jgi:hypothetical protein
VSQQDLPTREELTRRRWFLQLGEMAALAGISGWLPETTVSLLGSGKESAPFPLGLHTPSAPHLMHALAVHMTPPVSGTELPLPPQFFSEDDFQVVTRLVEIILGNVNAESLSQTTQWLDLWFRSTAEVLEAAQHLDPMHRALAVAYYGQDPVRELETADPQSVALEGIAAIRRLSLENYGRHFLELSPPQQIELVNLNSTPKPDNLLQSFFEIARREAIRGYYTSAAGLKELNYKGNAYYLDCPGCEGK